MMREFEYLVGFLAVWFAIMMCPVIVLIISECLYRIQRAARRWYSRYCWHNEVAAIKRRRAHVYPSPMRAVITRKASRDYSTATCSICGRYDESKPFIRYAIECHRKDCREDWNHVDLADMRDSMRDLKP